MDDISGIKTKEYRQKIRFIYENVNELRWKFRREIAQMISNNPEIKINEKGEGLQVNIFEIPIELINTIHNYIKNKFESVDEFV
jgi:hypothetical protein